MTKQNRIMSIAASLTVISAAFFTRATAQQSEWRMDYAAALQEAKQTGKPLFAVIR